jgi:hypothetical protein
MAFVLRAQWEVAGLNGAEAITPQKMENTKRKAVVL